MKASKDDANEQTEELRCHLLTWEGDGERFYFECAMFEMLLIHYRLDVE